MSETLTMAKVRDAQVAKLEHQLRTMQARLHQEQEKRKKYRADQDRFRTALHESEQRNAKLQSELHETQEKLRRALEREAKGWAG